MHELSRFWVFLSFILPRWIKYTRTQMFLEKYSIHTSHSMNSFSTLIFVFYFVAKHHSFFINCKVTKPFVHDDYVITWVVSHVLTGKKPASWCLFYSFVLATATFWVLCCSWCLLHDFDHDRHPKKFNWMLNVANLTERKVEGIN